MGAHNLLTLKVAQQACELQACLWVQMCFGFLDQSERVRPDSRPIRSESAFVENTLNLQGSQTSRARPMQPNGHCTIAAVQVDRDRPSKFLKPDRKRVQIR